MHESSLNLMGRLMRAAKKDAPGPRLLDVGSFDINGSYRSRAVGLGFDYTGFDVRKGPNVDVCDTSLAGIPCDAYDVIICGQMLEHDRDPFESVNHMKRIVRRGGYICLIAPREFHEHRHPIDCWRFLPDGMKVLLEGFEIVKCGVELCSTKARDGRPFWDTFAIAKRPA